MTRLLPAALAALALSLSACSDPSEAYTPVDQLPSADVPVAGTTDPAPLSEAEPLHEPAPVDPLPVPTDPEVPPMDPLPPPTDDTPLDDATRPPPVDPTMDDADPLTPADPR
ncbi:hypothetical protein [Luteimonas terricola]|uniref:Uncharacterized protein n=1 Tax=Luteimonas terricola TaxID=645597 RepID=A0ABQ2EMP8_9GAMM|nr:hypothetical protein [Luteimonas terricola]GGK16567.1 hypothetical protein GCM10011394_27240 [Luteimonas terricola]